MTVFNSLFLSPQWLKEYHTKYPHGLSVMENLIEWLNQVNELIDYVNVTPDRLTAILEGWESDGRLDAIIQATLSQGLNNVSRSLVLYPQLAGETDDTGRIQRLIDSTLPGETALIPYKDTPYEITGIKLKSSIKLDIKGDITLKGVNSTAFDLSGCTYVTIEGNNVSVFLPESGQTGMLVGVDSDLKPAQLNTIKNISFRGSHTLGSTSLIIDGSWVNNFYNCYFFRSANGVIIKNPGANANNFFGCEIRGINTEVNSDRAFTQLSGLGNAWFGGAIENFRRAIHVAEGDMFFNGVWIEAFSEGRPVKLSGGSVTFKNCHFLASAVIEGGDDFVFEDCRMPSAASAYNLTYPVISYGADVPTRLYTKGNKLAPGAYLTRFGKYRNSSGSYVDKSPDNMNEVNEEYATSIYMVSNVNMDGLAADATYHRVKFGTAVMNDPLDEMEDSTGYFKPKKDGIFKFSGVVYLTELPATGILNLIINHNNVRRTLKRIPLGNSTIETIDINAFSKMNVTDYLSFEVQITGSTGTFRVIGTSNITSLEITRR